MQVFAYLLIKNSSGLYVNSAESLHTARFTCSKLRKVSQIKRQAACKYIFFSLHKLAANVISVNTNLMRMFHQGILAKSKLWLDLNVCILLAICILALTFQQSEMLRAICSNASLLVWGLRNCKDNLRVILMPGAFSS